MGTTFKCSNDTEKMQLGEKISFSNLDFIPDQLKNLCLQEPESSKGGEAVTPDSVRSSLD